MEENSNKFSQDLFDNGIYVFNKDHS